MTSEQLIQAQVKQALKIPAVLIFAGQLRDMLEYYPKKLRKQLIVCVPDFVITQASLVEALKKVGSLSFSQQDEELKKVSMISETTSIALLYR